MAAPRHSLMLVATVALSSALLAACGGAQEVNNPPSSPAATTGNGAGVDVDPCALLTDADVAGLAPGLGHGTVKEISGATLCVWPNSAGVDAVQLMVLPATTPSLRAELEDGIAAFGGYDIVTVDGLGDEAAAAFQQADTTLGLEAGLAMILARSGDTVIQLSTPQVSVQQDSAAYETAIALVATALSQV
jgi:hypothetical protein